MLASILGVACGIGPSLQAHASASFVQAAASTTSVSASSFSLSFTANTVAGDLILVGFDFTGTTPSSLTDTQGNTYTEVGAQLTSPGGARSVVFYAKNIKGGADTVTVKLSANSPYIEEYITEYSGVDPTSPIDAQAGSSGSSSSVTSGSATTTISGDVIYGFCIADRACTVGTGFSARSTFDDNLIEDKTSGSPGGYAATGSANGGWTMQMVALKPSSSALAVSAAPAITSPSSASGTAGSAFSYQIAATNSPTSYGATGLPAGLTVSSGTGLISGTPAAAGTSTVTLSATNATGTGTATLTLTFAAPAPVITSAGSASGTAGAAFSYQISATNSPTSYGATGLPSGLTVNSGTGLISGTPAAAGTSTVTLSAINATGTGRATLTLTIGAAAPAITSASSANGTVGTAFSYQIVATNSPTSYGATGLPSGLTVNSGTGLISGTPTAAGTSTVTLSATNATGTGGATLTLTIQHSPAGPILATGQGYTLYDFLPDTPHHSACLNDGCVFQWPPLILTGPIHVGNGVNRALVGTLKRPDGSTQVSYGGHPLYTYNLDVRPGLITGQAIDQDGGPWYVISPKGAEIHTDFSVTS